MMLRIAEIRGRVIYRFKENINITKNLGLSFQIGYEGLLINLSYFQFSFFFSVKKKCLLQPYPYVKRDRVETDENKERNIQVAYDNLKRSVQLIYVILRMRKNFISCIDL